MNPKNPNPYIKTGCVKLHKELQKLIMLKNDFKESKHILMKIYINYVSNNYSPVNVPQLCSLYTWLVYFVSIMKLR